MASQNSSAVAPGPPPWTPEQLAAMPHDDAGRMLNTVLWVLVIFSAVFVTLRVHCKRSTNRALYWDDYILLASWICLLLDASAWSAAIYLGYGKHTWDVPTANFSNVILLAEIAGTFAITAAIWSKSAFAVTLLRLSEGWMKALIWVLLISTTIFLGLSAVFNFTQCIPIQKLWHLEIGGTCWRIKTLVNYHIFSGVYSAAMDFTLALLPWKLIWGLRILQKEKFGIGIAMSMGIFAGSTALIKTSSLHTLESIDIYDTIPIVYFGAIEISTTIVGASIPALRVLIRDTTSSAGDYFKTDDATVGNGRRNKMGICDSTNIACPELEMAPQIDS